MTNRRQEHLSELKDRFTHFALTRITLGMAETFGFSPYDLKIAHDDLVEKGYPPIPHLSDEAYKAAMQVRNSN